MITALILLVALGVLGWGFYRARPLGKFGILAWLQSVVLMAPWLAFFSLFAIGIYLNLASVLFLIVGSIALYIYLGRQLRSMANDEELMKRVAAMAEAATTKRQANATTVTPTTPTETPTHTTSAPPSETTETSIEGEAGATTTTTTTTATVPLEIPRISEADLQAIQSIFGIDTFFVTETIPYQDGAIFRGNLRGEPVATHARLSKNLQEKLGFSEPNPAVPRYRLFLIEGTEGKPVVVVLPSTNDPKPATVSQKILAIVLALFTAVTCFETAGILQNFDFFSNLDRYPEVLPIGSGILAILAVHEVGHWLVARRHHVRLSPPFLIPTSQIGSFGALNRFESILPDRSTLFDIAFAGPAVGGLLSFLLLAVGLALSHPGSLFQLPAQFFQGSILVGTLAKVVLGDALQQAIVDIHPLVVVGWLGLVITAINLLPAGQLDGGRIVLAIYGRKTAGKTTIAALIVLGLAALVSPLALYWAVLILFLQRDLERPALNEISEPDDARAALGILALFLMAATLLPLTPDLAGRLGIGG